MTEARHDHAVSLLTAASPTIALLLERGAGGPLPPSPPPPPPTPPSVASTAVAAATPGESGPLRLAPSLPAATLEGPYPVEVRPWPSPCVSLAPLHVQRVHTGWEERPALSVLVPGRWAFVSFFHFLFKNKFFLVLILERDRA